MGRVALAGEDEVSYATAGRGVKVDLSSTRFSRDVCSGDGNDRITGSAGDDLLISGIGERDAINGLAGEDT